MDTPEPAKLYAYVDESGQDTQGALFVVAVVVAGSAREALRRRLHRIERLSGKRERKWTNTRPAQREAYIRQVLQVRELSGADQAYVCLWSHAGWRPVHVHFVVQPVWNADRERFDSPGPSLQAAMFARNELPEVEAVVAFCDQARSFFQLARVDR